jgi:hypothetical protein
MTEHAAAADLAAMLRLCEAGKLRCSDKTRRPTAATVQLVAESLADGDFYLGMHGPVASFAWPLLLQVGGLAELAGTRLQLTSRGRAALEAPAHETLRHLWRRWRKHAPLDEFNRVDQIKGQASSGALTAAEPRRQIVADALACCPPGRWVDVDALFRFMQAEDLNLQVARDPWKLYLLDPHYGSLGYQGYHDWTLLQGRYVLCMLFEYAAPLGLIDLAYQDPIGARDDYHDNWGSDDLDMLSRYDGLRHIRLNGLGAYILGLSGGYRPSADPATPAATTRLRVLPPTSRSWRSSRCRSPTRSCWRPTPSAPATRCGRSGATSTWQRSPPDGQTTRSSGSLPRAATPTSRPPSPPSSRTRRPTPASSATSVPPASSSAKTLPWRP